MASNSSGIPSRTPSSTPLDTSPATASSSQPSSPNKQMFAVPDNTNSTSPLAPPLNVHHSQLPPAPSMMNNPHATMAGPQPSNQAASHQPLPMANNFPPIYNHGQTVPFNGYHVNTSNHHRSGMGGPRPYPSRIDQRPVRQGYTSPGYRAVQPSIPLNFQATYLSGGQAYNPSGSQFNGNLGQSYNPGGGGQFNGNGNRYQHAVQHVGPTSTAVDNPGAAIDGGQPMNSNVKGSASPAMVDHHTASLTAPSEMSTSDSLVKSPTLSAASDVTIKAEVPTTGLASAEVPKVSIDPPPSSAITAQRPNPSSICSIPSWMHDKKHPSPYSLTLNPLQLIQRDLHALSPLSKDEHLRNKLNNYLYNGWNAMIEMNNKIFNERTRCRLCGQTPRTEHSFRAMNHGFSRKASALWRELQTTLSGTNPEFVTLEQMEGFYDMYWEVERVFWEDDGSPVCGVGSWTGYQG